MTEITPQLPGDMPAIHALLTQAFGPGHGRKKANRLRAGRVAPPQLSFVARDGGRIVGTLRLWPIEIAEVTGWRHDALLLGPLAVDPALQAGGIGTALMKRGLDAADRMAGGPILLIGDPRYYARFGFDAVPAGEITLPGPFDTERLLIRQAAPGRRPRGLMTVPGTRLPGLRPLAPTALPATRRLRTA